ncbi:MAG: fused MFS/spermidine synthase [Propionibacteriaceae bacterium]|jgi:spermidine synthase|nr:fused MFS/spermidine synthase [Propionibacteriaceae bacterium]
MSEVVGGPFGTFLVRSGRTEQSWVYPNDPLMLEFEYVQRIAEALEACVIPRGGPVRVVHVGGGGLSLPRYIAARRPGTAQVVLEPDADLVEQVRARIPLPPRSGIRIRIVDGLAGIAEMPDDYADCIILDAFAGASVPPELVTQTYFADLARVLRPEGLFVANLTDRGPFEWSRRVMSGVVQQWPHVAMSAETPVWRGRRFGNLVALASPDSLPTLDLERALLKAAFPHRLASGKELTAWVGKADPFTVADAIPSPDPFARGWFT